MNENERETLEQILDKYENSILVTEGTNNKHILILIYNEQQFFDLPQKVVVPLEKDLKRAFGKKHKFKIFPINEIFLSLQQTIDNNSKV